MDDEPVESADDVQASLRDQEPQVLLAVLKRILVQILFEFNEEDVDDQVSYSEGRADDEQELMGENERTRRDQAIQIHSLHVRSDASEGEAERPSEKNAVACPEYCKEPSLNGQREFNSQGSGD